MYKRLLLSIATLAIVAAPVSAQDYGYVDMWPSEDADFVQDWNVTVQLIEGNWDYAIRDSGDGVLASAGLPGSPYPDVPNSWDYMLSYDPLGGLVSFTVGTETISYGGLAAPNEIWITTNAYDGDIFADFALGPYAGELASNPDNSGRHSWYLNSTELTGGFTVNGTIDIAARAKNADPGFYIKAGQGPTEVVPEPATLALLGTGLLGIFGIAYRRREDEEE